MGGLEGVANACLVGLETNRQGRRWHVPVAFRLDTTSPAGTSWLSGEVSAAFADDSSCDVPHVNAVDGSNVLCCEQKRGLPTRTFKVRRLLF